MYTCPICHNNQRNYFGLKNGEIYCRKCISFIGEKINNQEEVINNHFLNINYQLSEEQKKISSKVVDLINNKKNFPILPIALFFVKHFLIKLSFLSRKLSELEW